MKKFAFVACPEEFGSFKDAKTGKTVEYRTFKAIMNECELSSAGDVVACHLKTFKVSKTAEINFREVKPGTYFGRLSFDEYGRLTNAK